MPTAGALIGAGLRVMIGRRSQRLAEERSLAARAASTQCAQLRWLLNRARDTEFGRAHAFAAIAARDDAQIVPAYRDAVPVRQYEDHLPDLRRMREAAEPDVLWPGLVMDWAQTSGTTAGDKFMPVSEDLLRHNRKAALDIYAHALRFGVSLPQVFAGKVLWLGGSTALSANAHGVRTGDLSGVTARLVNWPLSALTLPDRRTSLIPDWPVKLDRMARQCLDADVRMVNGMPSWTLVLVERLFELARERGRSVSTLRDIWPSLGLFVHGGVKYAPFERRVREVWSGDPDGPDLPHRIEVYPASEGFIAIQDRAGDPGLRLNIDHRVYYEFVPLEEFGTDRARAFDVSNVAPAQRYVVVMTTCAGLWRYDLADVVEFDTVPPDGPPRLRIVGRRKHFINAFGENLIVEHIENAVAHAARAVEVTVGEFTAAPVYPSAAAPAGLELLIEWPAPRDRVDAFRHEFDEALKRQNVDYATKRGADLGMAPPTITLASPGAFHRWMQRHEKLGGQHKCPRCANHRETLESVLRSTQAAEGASVDARTDHAPYLQAQGTPA